MNKPAVVCDAGPLIALAACGCLDLLTAIFAAIHVPQAVLDEVSADHTRPDARTIADFVQRHGQVHAARDDALYRTVINALDEGEAQTLSVAHALGCAVLMDERMGRNIAIRHGLPLFGVLGVLLQAKRIGKIRRVTPFLADMQHHGYRIAPSLLEKVLALADETG